MVSVLVQWKRLQRSTSNWKINKKIVIFFFLHNKVPSLLIYHCQIPSKPLYLMKKKKKEAKFDSKHKSWRYKTESNKITEKASSLREESREVDLDEE